MPRRFMENTSKQDTNILTDEIDEVFHLERCG